VTMRMNPGVRRDNGTVPSRDSAQPLREVEFFSERAVLPHVPSSIWGMPG
jgi:hypothetical protein